ncbi:hypothetical protein A1O3_00189 [Capronia epimyces CBS 606.96]|uniref:Amidase domain-containing protein n=1 Tax=Capronia epimyces CBS 606.96 TaxID=1182542 RepID=W9ZAT8_9EURO|nr:uncharacterized protein A1O3_00189 [Capronia epimyces CBS 606.96]EXJ91639.1 hypothetical protein A1O3_00189 [Capronia epimyces CBS 606.96]
MIERNPISKAIAIRDKSLAVIEPPLDLDRLPDPLPPNVTQLPYDFLTDEEITITSLDVDELLARLRNKQLSCVQVTKAFLRRAALAQQLVNCVTELLPETALERARYLDSLDQPIGPLHGLPISLKEHHGMRGRLTNCALVACIDNQPPIKDEVSGVNDVLWEAGAVFHARTTQPQSLMHLETSSNIYGVTLNPNNLKLSPGGSSGGESALIRMRGSILGIGGDSGGSIRVPAANTGIYGFKPTSGRVTRRGTASGVPRSSSINGSHGPLSTSRYGLELFMSTYLNSQPWYKDVTLVPLPWREITLQKHLKIAIMWSDGVVNPHPPVQRALRQVATMLQKNKAQFTVVDWEPLEHDRGWELTQSLYYGDGGAGLKKILADGNEEALPLSKWMLESKNVRARSREELNQLTAERDKYWHTYNDHWQATGEKDGHIVDAILCPAGPGAAPAHGHSKYWSYTSQWNLLDYPAAVFPVTVVDQALDQPETDYQPMNSEDKRNHELYDPGTYRDAPVGLQLVTRRYEDEKCLAILAAIERVMGRK